MIDCVADLQEGLIKNVLSGVTSIYAIIIAIIICIACSWICIYSIVKIQKNKNIFHKISVQGNEIEIFESQESRQDLPLEEAARLAARLSLRPVQHPRMGRRSF